MVTVAPERTKTLILTAKRLRKQDRTGLESELVIVCPDCGDSFSIAAEVPSADPALAQRHGAWLVDQLIWDHIQHSKHRGSIRLPSAQELLRSAHTR